ncbi:hypothetical protein FNQ90_08780 [Streptomyces alkaliphilus]|uniref:Uncharacterized protein n=1 Tax=Streptomyces alkaliphilus TaxID=1472722 RepID=A0A7W3Y160_9ACTN|nr:hypothetical protein [Streptomyces alkaliphilus]MBB0244198.1 hypothetical protein [Streptomyces alkaliphilus]
MTFPPRARSPLPTRRWNSPLFVLRKESLITFIDHHAVVVGSTDGRHTFVVLNRRLRPAPTS